MMDSNGNGVSESTGDTVSLEFRKRKREKRVKEKKRRKKEKKKRKHRISDSEPENRKRGKKSKERKSDKEAQVDDESIELPGPSVPAELLAEQAKARAPMTKEEWEKSQDVIRKVYDETTGRTRLIKGDGEILEEIVTRDKHREINKQATAGDGAYFQNQLQSDRK